MEKLTRKLKSMKNATQSQYQEAIKKYAYDEVINDLKDAGIEKEDLCDDEFQELLDEKIKKSKMHANTILAAGGVLLFLELLGWMMSKIQLLDKLLMQYKKWTLRLKNSNTDIENNILQKDSADKLQEKLVSFGIYCSWLKSYI